MYGLRTSALARQTEPKSEEKLLRFVQTEPILGVTETPCWWERVRFRIVGWSLPNGPKILCGASSRNSVPRSSRVKKTISSWHSNPSPRSTWRTRCDVHIPHGNWVKTVTLPEVDEDQEEVVWRVLEIRFRELIQDDETEWKQSVHVTEPDGLPDSTDKSDNSQKTNLLGWKKTSKMVPPPDLAPAQNVVDVGKLDKEVIPRNTNFLRPLLYTD